MGSPSHQSLLEAQGTALARRDFATAERMSQALLAQAPGDPLHWIALGELRLAQGRVGEAARATARAVALAPHDPDIALRHARALFATGDRMAGLAALDAAAGRDGLGTPQNSLIGALYAQAEQPGRALPFLRKAAEAEPANGAHLYNLAACQRMTGDFENAWRNCERAIAYDPDNGEAALLRADLNRVIKAPPNLPALRDALERCTDRENEIFLRFALVREAEDSGQHAEAFAQALAGNRLKRLRLRYDVAEDIAVLDTLRQAHDREAVMRAGEGWRTSAPIFVMGLPRTGTTLVERILLGHDQIRSAGEPLAFGKVMSRQLAAAGFRGGKVDAIQRSLGLDMTALGKAYVEETRAHTQADARHIDKLPLNYLYVGLIRAALPDARIILVERDPMDTLWAIYKTLFAGAYPFAYDLAELAQYQRAHAKLVRHWRAAFGDAILHVRYEDVVADLEGQARRIVAYCGLDWQARCRAFERAAGASTTASAVQVRMPLYSNSVGLWRRYEDQLMAHLPAA